MMESPQEATEHIRKLVLNSANENGLTDVEELLKLVGLGEFTEETADVLGGLTNAEHHQAADMLLSGHLDKALEAQGTAALVAFLTGYRLGCSHTAERVTGKES